MLPALVLLRPCLLTSHHSSVLCERGATEQNKCSNCVSCRTQHMHTNVKKNIDMKRTNMCQELKHTCVATWAEWGDDERWEVAWWDNRRQLSPINSLYMSPSLCTVTPYSQHLTMWQLHLSLYELHFMKIISSCRLLLLIFFVRAAVSPRWGNIWKTSALCPDSPPPAGWAVPLFPNLLFWFSFRTALASISPQPACKWMSVSCYELLILGNKRRDKKSRSAVKENISCNSNLVLEGLTCVLVDLGLRPLWC